MAKRQRKAGASAPQEWHVQFTGADIGDASADEKVTAVELLPLQKAILRVVKELMSHHPAVLRVEIFRDVVPVTNSTPDVLH